MTLLKHFVYKKKYNFKNRSHSDDAYPENSEKQKSLSKFYTE